MKERDVEILIQESLNAQKPDRRVLARAENEMDNDSGIKHSTFVTKRKTWYAVSCNFAAVILLVAIAIPLLIIGAVGDGDNVSDTTSAITKLEQSPVFFLTIGLGVLGLFLIVGLIFILLKLNKHKSI